MILMKFTVRLLLILGLLLLGPIPAGTGGAEQVEVETQIQALLGSTGVEFGVHVVLAGKGVLLSRNASVPRHAASAIKTAILVDLLRFRGDQLDQVPRGVEALLQVGTHPAFAGFLPEELARAREHLPGRTYLELARIMMGRTDAPNEVYNAACNVIMVKLGGPPAIARRLHDLDPALEGIDIHRYMQSWNGDGDNTATPEALVNLYSMTSSRSVPGLGAECVSTLRSLLLEDGDGGPGSIFGKVGTLYPEPMVRVHAGFQDRAGGDLVFAVMGEVSHPPAENPTERFVELMSVVDELARLCRDLAPSIR